jgi:alpha-glucosidase (family GH31 glycosyl hydrolase)
MRNEDYPTLVKGQEQNVFVKDLNGVDPYLGQVWPGPTYYPDWFADNTTSWWTDELIEFHDLADYDGLWIDMNEISNFCNVDGAGQGM